MKASGISEVRTYAAFLGFGFYWAWVTVVFYSDALAPGVSGADGMVETVWLWATWAHAIALLSHAALAHRFPSALDGRALKLGGSIGTAVGTALIPLVLFSFGTESLISTGSIPVFAVLIGVTSAWLVLQWAERYAALARGRVTTLSLLSFLCGLFVYFLFIALPAPITTVTAVMLPLFSGASMAFCEIDGARVLSADGEKSERGATGETHLLPRFSIGLLLSAFAVFVFALCGEMLRAFSLQLTNAGVNEMGSLYLLGGTLGLLALTTYLIAPVGRRDRKRITLSLVRNILIIMAAAFLLAPFLSGISLSVSYGIFGAGFWCFRAISWIMCLLIVARFGYRPVRAVGVMDGAFALSVVVSTQLNSWLVETIKVGGTELTTVALITVFVLMFIVVVVLNGKETGGVLRETVGDDDSHRSGSAVPRDEEISFCIDGIAEEYGLSPREAEVALLLAKGRSLPFIQNELYISSGTAQTHARHIYKKLDIHSRQEFLDIVERRISSRE